MKCVTDSDIRKYLKISREENFNAGCVGHYKQKLKEELEAKYSQADRNMKEYIVDKANTLMDYWFATIACFLVLFLGVGDYIITKNTDYKIFDVQSFAIMAIVIVMVEVLSMYKLVQTLTLIKRIKTIKKEEETK